MTAQDYSFNNIKYCTSQVYSSGTQATLIEGIDESTGKVVIIKLFPNQNGKPPKAFDREAYALKLLKGKSHICSSVGSTLNSNFALIGLTKYYCDLYQFAFESTCRMTLKEIQRIFRKICKGVKNMHQEGVAHLDLKPENVLISKNGKEVAICDFGMSYISKSKERKVVSLRGPRGTKQYAAPELINSLTVNPFAADIYSLGCTLYVLITAIFPTCDSNEELWFPPGVSCECIDLINSMLCKNPLERLSIEEVLLHSFVKRKGSFLKFLL